MGSRIITCTVVLIALACTTVSGAYVDEMSRKADRGFSNVLGGWLEIPYQTYTEAKGKGLLLGPPVGLGKGVCMTVCRMLSGVVDLVTFPVPFPNRWRGLIRPEYNPWVEAPEQPEPVQQQPVQPGGQAQPSG